MQGNDAVGGALATQQLDFDVVDKEFLAVILVHAGELIAASIVARLVVDVLVGGGPGAPDQLPFAVEDVTEQTGIRQVVTLVRQQCGHLQLAMLDARR
ncbi:hypothetical protein D3C81_1568120 [compost metagenome]